MALCHTLFSNQLCTTMKLNALISKSLFLSLFALLFCSGALLAQKSGGMNDSNVLEKTSDKDCVSITLSQGTVSIFRQDSDIPDMPKDGDKGKHMDEDKSGGDPQDWHFVETVAFPIISSSTKGTVLTTSRDFCAYGSDQIKVQIASETDATGKENPKIEFHN